MKVDLGDGCRRGALITEMRLNIKVYVKETDRLAWNERFVLVNSQR